MEDVTYVNFLGVMPPLICNLYFHFDWLCADECKQTKPPQFAKKNS